MRAQQWTDAAIIEAIGNTEQTRDLALYHIVYQTDWKKMIIAYVVQHGGDTHDGDDVFQEALFQFDRNIRMGFFEGKSALKTYFFVIAKRRWWKISSRRKPTQELSPEHYEGEAESAEARVISEEKRDYLRKATAQIGERCQKILQLYQLDYSMEEIAEAVGLSSDDMAKKEAYRCRTRLRQFLENNPDWKNLLN